MKKQKTLAVLLSAAMVAGAIPTAALAEVVGSNSDSGVKAAELSEDQEIEEQNEDSEDEGSGFVLMNVPYDKVYESDIQNDTKVDAVSSATKEKTRKKKVVNGTYHSEDGSEIKLKEGSNMCEALKELFADDLRESREQGIIEGRIDGRNAGRIEGRIEGRCDITCNSYSCA